MTQINSQAYNPKDYHKTEICNRVNLNKLYNTPQHDPMFRKNIVHMDLNGPDYSIRPI